MLRRDVTRLQAAKDHIRPTDIANILDYLEDIAGGSDADLRTAALSIRDVEQISSSDMGRLYDYIADLGTPALTKTEFLNRRMRDRDFMSRRNLEYILDTIDESFGAGTYEAMVFRDMPVAGSFWTVQAEAGISKAALTDSGPNDVTVNNSQTPPIEAPGPFPGTISVEWTTTQGNYNITSGSDTWALSEDATFEAIVMPTAAGDQLRAIWGPGNNTPHNRVALYVNTTANGANFQLTVDQDDGDLDIDPGTWVANTAYAQGDRARPVVDDDHMYECEVAGTSAVVSAGTQAVDFGGAITGPTGTGLTDGATTYDANVTVDGGLDVIQIVGSTSQDFDELIIALDLQTTGGTWSIIGGDLVCTSAATGETSTILIVDGPLVGDELLWSSITNFDSILAAVDGDGEPTFPTDQGIVVDGDVTWRHVCLREAFHDLDIVALAAEGRVVGPSSAAVVNDTWYHVAVVKNSGGVHLYVNGVLQTPDGIVQVADTDPGSFGLPVRMQFDTASYAPANVRFGGSFSGPTGWRGRIAYVATYDNLALTAAQLVDHYDAAINQGMPG
jgi:hypothetical protein